MVTGKFLLYDGARVGTKADDTFATGLITSRILNVSLFGDREALEFELRIRDGACEGGLVSYFAYAVEDKGAPLTAPIA